MWNNFSWKSSNIEQNTHLNGETEVTANVTNKLCDSGMWPFFFFFFSYTTLKILFPEWEKCPPILNSLLSLRSGCTSLRGSFSLDCSQQGHMFMLQHKLPVVVCNKSVFSVHWQRNSNFSDVVTWEVLLPIYADIRAVMCWISLHKWKRNFF